MIGCYYESWAMPWSSVGANELNTIDDNIDTIYLAFAKPDNTYMKNQRSFSGTGLDFSSSFDIIAKSITLLRSKGKLVFLAVGGGAYWSEPKPVNVQGCVDLMNDLGCDGIDIDWEVGITDEQTPVNFIRTLFPLMKGNLISFTCFSTGVFEKNINDKFSGMNIKAIKECSAMIDQINIMAYDAGYAFSEINALKAYRAIYDGTLNMGFEIGKQGWGDALLNERDLKNAASATKDEAKDNGCFFWAYYSQPYMGSISRKDAVALAYSIFKPVYTPPPKPPPPPPTKPTYSCPSSVFILCPTCKTKIKTSWSKE